jgi:threonine efflux protein
MDTIGILAGIAVVQFLAAASPGPNFILVTSQAMAGSRRHGFLMICGILLATLTWAVLAACGLGVLMARVPALYTALQLASAAYLIWLGVKMLLAVWRSRGVQAAGGAKALAGWSAVRAGFITNMTNPKSIAYYSSLFVVMIPADPPLWLFAAAVATAFLTSVVWWSALVLFFAVGPVRRTYERARRAIDAVLGGLLILVGVRLVVAGR